MNVAAGTPAPDEYTHAFRRNPFCSERFYRLVPEGLEWRERESARFVAYRDIVQIIECKTKVWGALAAHLPRRFDYVVRRRDGGKILIQPVHHAGLGRTEDRSASCGALIAELKKRVATANPEAKFSSKLGWAYRLDMTLGRMHYRAAASIWNLARHLPFDLAANFCGAVMRQIGPWLRGHRTARANLIAAYPEKSAAEIERLLSDMWDNLGRLGIEYINLDRLIDPAKPNGGRIVVTPGAIDILERLRDDGKPAVLFTSHLASYELGAIWGERNGLKLAILYNPTNFGPITERRAAMQRQTMGRLVASGPDSVRQLRDALKSGLHLALFADQQFATGVEVKFFGRPCKVNPMAARFARMFACPVHGFRTIRLPDNKIQVDVTEELQLPRGRDGRIDIAAAMQQITSVIEGWVRQHPEQWLWIQRRWR